MITIRENIAQAIRPTGKTGPSYKWVDARELTRDDISVLEEDYNISSEFLADILDVDEQARIEKEDDHVAMIVRMPASSAESFGINQYSVPLGIVLQPGTIITICQSNTVILEDFARNRFRQYPVETIEGFVISLIGRTITVYIRLLKYLNRQKDLIAEELHRRVHNEQLVELLAIQKSLVYLSTSMSSNDTLLEKLVRSPLFVMNSEEERDFLDDAIVDNKQALLMANIYTSILNGTIEGFASIISNNLNTLMKRLSIIVSMVALPLFLVGFYSTNLAVPFSGKTATPYVILGVSVAWIGAGISLLRTKKIKVDKGLPRTRRLGGKRR